MHATEVNTTCNTWNRRIITSIRIQENLLYVLHLNLCYQRRPIVLTRVRPQKVRYKTTFNGFGHHEHGQAEEYIVEVHFIAATFICEMGIIFLKQSKPVKRWKFQLMWTDLNRKNTLYLC